MTDGAAESVRNWLRNEGFPLEMRAARAFARRPSLSVLQGEYYRADEDDRAREIDLTVSRSVAIDTHLVMTVMATVECKTLGSGGKDKRQAVAFRAGGTPTDMQIFRDRTATNEGAAWLGKLWFATQELDLPLMRGRAPQAYGITTTWQSDSGGRSDARARDVAYKAVESASAAAAGITRAWQANEDVTVVGFAIPLVVLSGDLFVAGLARDSDDVAVRRVERVQLLWRNRVWGSAVTIVDVVTEAGLDEWVSDFEQTTTALLETEGHAVLARQARSELGPQVY